MRIRFAALSANVDRTAAIPARQNAGLHKPTLSGTTAFLLRFERAARRFVPNADNPQAGFAASGFF
jgi:hypothetical protein